MESSSSNYKMSRHHLQSLLTAELEPHSQESDCMNGERRYPTPRTRYAKEHLNILRQGDPLGCCMENLT